MDSVDSKVQKDMGSEWLRMSISQSPKEVFIRLLVIL